MPKGWSAYSDVRVQRFLKRPLVSPDVPDEQAPIISTHGALEAIAPQARPLESYSADELRLAAARVPKHLAAEYANEAYHGPNRELYQRARALGLNESSAAQWAQTGAPPASVETEDETSLGEPTVVDNPDDARDEATEQQAFVTHSRNPRVREAFERLNALLDTFQDSEQFKRYLEFVARVPRYSFHNVMMIFSQRPNASVVMGYKKWQEFGRHVMRGERGIDILAPLITKVPVVDENGDPVLDEEGKPLTKQKLVGFKTVKVFDIKQTDGKPIPLLDERIEGDRHVELRDRMLEVIRRKGIPVSHQPLQRMRGARGQYLLDDRKIWIAEGMSPDQEAKTLIHEYAHALMHADFDDSGTIVVGGGPSPERQQIEVEAEAVAYIVASAFGFDTSDQSVGYVCAWSGGDKRKLRASLERITKTAQQIIEEIERVPSSRTSRSNTTATPSAPSPSVRLRGRTMEQGRPVYREFSLDELTAKAASGEVSIETKRYKLNGREVVTDEGTGIASFSAGGGYGTLEVRDGKLVLHTQVRGELAEVEIDPRDVEMVSLF